MTDFTYNNDYLSISGTIDGSDFHSNFLQIETAINSKADKAGPVTYTGTHTFANLTVSGTFTGDIDGGTY